MTKKEGVQKALAHEETGVIPWSFCVTFAARRKLEHYLWNREDR
jgi:hypothetical protein